MTRQPCDLADLRNVEHFDQRPASPPRNSSRRTGASRPDIAFFHIVHEVVDDVVVADLDGVALIDTARAAVTIHRDFGDRTNRKHARLKYVIQERGAAWFRAELEKRLGFKLETARPFQFTRQGDLYGWHQQFDGKWFLGLFVENGRIKDAAITG